MKPEQIQLIERVSIALGWAGMSVALAGFDWRIGLFFASALWWLAALDIPWRRR